MDYTDWYSEFVAKARRGQNGFFFLHFGHHHHPSNWLNGEINTSRPEMKTKQKRINEKVT